jgi:hypothetical protein
MFVIACGGKQQPPPKTDDPNAGVVKDTRTELEKRRDAACENVGKLTAKCAAEDAKRDFEAGKTKQADYEADTKPAIVAKLAAKVEGECKAHKDYSSRQIRVMEKCPQYETECGPLMECLHNVQPQK